MIVRAAQMNIAEVRTVVCVRGAMRDFTTKKKLRGSEATRTPQPAPWRAETRRLRVPQIDEAARIL